MIESTKKTHVGEYYSPRCFCTTLTVSSVLCESDAATTEDFEDLTDFTW